MKSKLPPILVFDIETVPDVETGRALYNLTDLTDDDVAKVLFTKRVQDTNGSDFLPHYLQRIIAISVVLRYGDSVSVWSLGDIESSEDEILQRFFDGIKKTSPVLVSWNGSGFDLPVIHYRSLKLSVASDIYWDDGEINSKFKYNNYRNRFHNRHLDLMDILSGYQNRAFSSLDNVSTMLGFPGKMGVSGGDVWDIYLDGDLKAIRNYCETDVLNTYLVYLQFELIRGNLSKQDVENEHRLLIDHISSLKNNHLIDFVEKWKGN